VEVEGVEPSSYTPSNNYHRTLTPQKYSIKQKVHLLFPELLKHFGVHWSLARL